MSDEPVLPRVVNLDDAYSTRPRVDYPRPRYMIKIDQSTATITVTDLEANPPTSEIVSVADYMAPDEIAYAARIDDKGRPQPVHGNGRRWPKAGV